MGHLVSENNTMQEHTIALRVLSRTMTPGDISSKLGLEPTCQREKTDRLRENLWEFEVEHRAEPGDFPGRIVELLEALSEYKEKIVLVQREANVVLWGACFSDGPEVTLYIEPEIMERLSEFGVKMSYSVYYGS